MELHELDELLAKAKLPEITVPLCLRGDLQAEWETLERELASIRERSSGRLAGNGGESELAGRIRDLEEEMQSSTITVRLRALRRQAWMELCAAHPPREDHQADRILGVNQETFFDALITACVVEPVMDEERLERLFDSLTDRQYQRLADASWGLNRKDVDVPFSQTASRITTNSGGTSKRQSGSASPTNAGRGGSRKKSSSTSTKTAS